MQSPLSRFSFEDLSKLTPAELSAQKFCFLWHQWDFIQAPTPVPGKKPAWERVSDYPLEPRSLFRKWRSLNQLIGVSFGDTTDYCLLDLDIGSQYHPRNNQEAFDSLLFSLEEIGLVRPLAIQSSESGGLHIYFPLARSVKTFALANLLIITLESSGFKVAPGQLEIFPNLKTWKPKGQGFSLYNGHRLPLQQSSYLLDRTLNPQGNNLEQFLYQWVQAAAGQDQESLESAIATTKIHKSTPHNPPRSRKAEDWYQESQAIIAEGFTGFSQTNALIKKIGEFGRVFVGEVELAGEALLQYMLDTIKNCPGYQQYCRHKHEIKKRCRHWLPLIEKWYSHYCSRPPRPRTGLTNEERSQAAQSRIKAAVADLEASGSLPQGVKARMSTIAAYGVAAQTLYKFKPLWYPGIYQQTYETLGTEGVSANHPEISNTPEPMQTKGFHTPPIRSFRQFEVAVSDLQVSILFHKTLRRDPSTENGAFALPPNKPLEVQESSPALVDQRPSPPASSQPPVLKGQPSPQEQIEFNEWFQLAQQLGVVIDSDIEEGEFWVLTAEEWQPYGELASTFSLRYLRRQLGIQEEPGG